ncbi:MAG: iron-containing redox enzyme family protein [Pseudomonadota bacterium]
MTALQAIQQQFESALAEFSQCRAIKLLQSGDMTVDDYKWVLRQIFHHARENPQIQALATVYFRGEQREAVRGFLTHAVSEIGHDKLALNDLACLGEDVSGIPTENPLPATTALIALPFYQIYNLNPVGYLGYLYFLEFTPTSVGGAYMEALAAKGVPPEAMTFLKDHVTIDVGHNKLMEGYIEKLVNTEADLSAVSYAMQVTARLYANMLDGAVEQARKNIDFGRNTEETFRFPLSEGERGASEAAA